MPKPARSPRWLWRGRVTRAPAIGNSRCVAQILGAIHAGWNVRASVDSVSIESETPMPALLAELALPSNLLLKRNTNHLPIGTGPFLIAEWLPGKLLRLAANEDSWAGRP